MLEHVEKHRVNMHAKYPAYREQRTREPIAHGFQGVIFTSIGFARLMGRSPCNPPQLSVDFVRCGRSQYVMAADVPNGVA